MLRTLMLSISLPVLGIINPCALVAQLRSPLPALEKVTLQDAHSFALCDPATGGVYHIYVGLPTTYTSVETRFPVVYTLDANAVFTIVTQMHRLLRVDPTTADVIIVGIGYQGSPAERRAQRGRDLTPTPSSNPNSGHSEAFLAFLVNELIPLIDSQYRTIRGDRTIHGHSLGGLFALNAMFRKPSVFQRYIVSSPSLWWDDGIVIDMEAAFAAQNTSLPIRVFLSVGANEADDMRARFLPFIDVMRARHYEGLQLEAIVMPGEDHLSVVASAFARGLRSVFRGDASTTAASER